MPNSYTKEIHIRDGLNEGYRYFCDKDHPLARGNSGMVLLHRHIASVKLDRWLLPGEVVHHIDHNRLNNDPTNLEVLTQQEHALIHSPNSLGECTCIDCGTVFQKKSQEQKYCSNTCRTNSSIKNKSILVEELQRDIWEYPYTQLTTKYSLSDVGIKKRAKSLGCVLPPPYYHNKQSLIKLSIRKETLGY